MNKKHIGSNVMDIVGKWEKDPAFKKAVDEHVERAKLAKMLKEIREKEHITQAQLARRARVTQSVIARAESPRAGALLRLDLFRRILDAMGYETIVTARKGKFAFKAAL